MRELTYYLYKIVKQGGEIIISDKNIEEKLVEHSKRLAESFAKDLAKGVLCDRAVERLELEIECSIDEAKAKIEAMEDVKRDCMKKLQEETEKFKNDFAENPLKAVRKQVRLILGIELERHLKDNFYEKYCGGRKINV